MKSDIGNEQNWQQIEAGYVCTNLSSILSNCLSRLGSRSLGAQIDKIIWAMILNQNLKKNALKFFHREFFK